MKRNAVNIPATWKLLTAADCPTADQPLTPAREKWFSVHEHSHIYREVLAVVKGHCLLRIDGRLIELKRGEMLLVDSRVPHTLGHLKNDPAVYCWLTMMDCQLNVLFWRHNRIDSVTPIDVGSFTQVLEKLVDELDLPAASESAKKELRGFLASLISAVFRHIPDQESFSEKYTGSEGIIHKILTYIDTTPEMNFTVASLAAMAHFSPSHFQRLFKKYTDESFRSYLQKKRVERYHNLCEKKFMTKKEIATKLGFASTSALNHWEEELRFSGKEK